MQCCMCPRKAPAFQEGSNSEDTKKKTQVRGGELDMELEGGTQTWLFLSVCETAHWLPEDSPDLVCGQGTGTERRMTFYSQPIISICRHQWPYSLFYAPPTGTPYASRLDVIFCVVLVVDSSFCVYACFTFGVCIFACVCTEQRNYRPKFSLKLMIPYMSRHCKDHPTSEMIRLNYFTRFCMFS